MSIKVTPEMTELLTDVAVDIIGGWLKKRRQTGGVRAPNREEVRAALLQRLVDSGMVESPDVLDQRGRANGGGGS